MATNTNITTTFAGRVAGKFISKSFEEAQTIDKKLISVLTGIVDGRAVIRLIDGTNGTVDFTCGWVPAGTLTLGEKVLEPKKLMLQQEFCKEDFRNNWDGFEMGYSAWNEDLPKDMKTAILDRILNQLAQTIDEDIWTGIGTQSGHFDGIIPQLVADAGTIDVVGTTVSNANVIAEMNKVYDAIPDNIMNKPDLVMIVSLDVYKKYIAAQSALGYLREYYNTSVQPLYFNTVRLEVVNGLPANTMIAYRISNFWLGTALTSDFNQVKVVDHDTTDLDDMVRVKVVYAADTIVAYPNEVVLYKQA